MATNTAGTAARLFQTQQVHYLRKSITYESAAQTVVGTIPSGSLILKPASGVHITTAFNAATTNTIDIGTASDDDLFGTALAAGSLGFVALDESIGGFLVTSDTTITVSYEQTGTAATAGAAEVVICFIPDNDR